MPCPRFLSCDEQKEGSLSLIYAYNTSETSDHAAKSLCLGGNPSHYSVQLVIEASVMDSDYNPCVMGLSSKSLKGNDCRKNLRTYAAGYGVNLRRLCAKGQEVFSMPNRDKGVLPPNSDVGGVMTLPRHLELLKEPSASALAKKIQTETIS